MTVLLAPPAWRELARSQAGVLARGQALRAGLHRRSWEHLVATGRGRLLLPGVVLLGAAAPDVEQRAWAALLYAGEGAAVAGSAALVLEGARLDVGAVGASVVDVAVPLDRRVRPQPSRAWQQVLDRQRQVLDRQRHALEHRPARAPLVVRPRRLLRVEELVHPARSPRRVRPVHAALQAAAWSRTDAAAEAVLCTVVQQRLTVPALLRSALEVVPRLPRRRLVAAVVDDLALGVQARGERDFLRLLRETGLPLPDRLQREVRVRSGRRYLDAWWERTRLGVEVDGAHHLEVATWEDDVLRANEVALAHRDDRALLLRFTTGQLRHARPVVVRQLKTALL